MIHSSKFLTHPQEATTLWLFLSYSLAPIYKWSKRTQNLCHMTRALPRKSRLSQLASSPTPTPMHPSPLLAFWFLRRATQWGDKHMHLCFPRPSQGAEFPIHPRRACPSSKKCRHQMAAVPHRAAQRPVSLAYSPSSHFLRNWRLTSEEHLYLGADFVSR